MNLNYQTKFDSNLYYQHYEFCYLNSMLSNWIHLLSYTASSSYSIISPSSSSSLSLEGKPDERPSSRTGIIFINFVLVPFKSISLSDEWPVVDAFVVEENFLNVVIFAAVVVDNSFD
ncbi:hypothetical protein DERP_008032 [Dermatophagoides pteronyssinus]|uniref:Uncharacterized protein n=1 Tax=Dermatophagoides pteronyssinus TaxID=6956 RepID=A0ABQ8ITA8_DERPT|nr:hypothetical protein DERP_008032 [Dermatophagoides pteronyssinus]